MVPMSNQYPNKGEVPADLLKYSKDVNSELHDSVAFSDYQNVTQLQFSQKQRSDEGREKRIFNEEIKETDQHHLSMYYQMKKNYEDKKEQVKQKEKKYGYKGGKKCFKSALLQL